MNFKVFENHIKKHDFFAFIPIIIKSLIFRFG